MLTKLSERARTLLEDRHFAVLATVNEDGTPHLTTMWYLLERYNDTDIILMNTKWGRVKERNMRRNPYISVCIEHGYSYVTISGTVELIDDSEMARADICRLAVRYDGMESAMQQMRERFSKEQRVSLHLKCEKVSEYFSQ
jgi:PPOX class probable F420-dependent enzyme